MNLKLCFLLANVFIGNEAVVPLIMSWTSSIKLIENHDSTPIVTDIGPPTTHAIALDYHYRRNELYFSDVLGRIYRGRLNGDNVSEPQVILDVRLTDGLAVDWAHDRLYWTDVTAKTVESATLDGIRRRVLFNETDGVDKPRGVAVDPDMGLLFWTDWGTKARVESSGLDGRERRIIVSTGLMWPNGIAADLGRQRLYILDGLNAALSTCNYDGSGFKTIKQSAIIMLQAFGVTYFDNKVYWGSWATHTLFSYNLNSEELSTVLKRTDGLRVVRERMMGVKAMDVVLQPLPSDDPCSSAGCQQSCLVGRGRRATCLCEYGYSLNPDGKTCTEEGYLLLSWRKTIRRHELNGTSHQALLDGAHAAIALSYHHKKGLVFWSDIEEHRIYSAPLDQLNNKSVVARPETCDGLAVDWTHDVLYWSDTDRNTIHAARFDGANDTIIVEERLDQPRDIALDPANGLMFWTDWGRTPKIERAVLDGSDRRTLVSTDIVWPNGITLDLDKKVIYWVDGKLATITSCSYEGTNRNTVLTEQTVSRQPFSITFFQTHIYWSDWNSQSIFKAETESTTSITKLATSFGTNIMRPNGLRVVHSSLQPETQNACASMRCNGLCLGRMHQNGIPQARCLGHSTTDTDLEPEPDTTPKCMSNELICNGKKDCPDGSDEDVKFCAAIEGALIYKKNITEAFFRVTVYNRTRKQLEKFVGDYRMRNSEARRFEAPLEPCNIWPESFCFNISSLAKNRMYNFSISAYLKGGQQGESILLSSRLTEGLPGPPENVAVSHYTSSSVELQWTHPTEANGIIRSYAINIQEQETYQEDKCCQTFPEMYWSVTSEEPAVKIEMAGLFPASTYNFFIAAKTLYLGTPKQIEVNTPPPPMPILRRPPTVIVQSSTSTQLTWNDQSTTAETDNTDIYSKLISYYLLVSISTSGSGQNITNAYVYSADLKPLQPILEENFGKEYILEWQRKSTEEEASFTRPITISPPSDHRYKAAWVQVSEYKGSYNLDFMESKPFSL